MSDRSRPTALSTMSPRKKIRTRKQTAPATSGNAPPKKTWIDLPFDVMCLVRRASILVMSHTMTLRQITQHLTPAELLSISRLNKDHRSFLTGEIGAVLWRQARRNIVGLPECPGWLTEIQYAALCFETHCQRCLCTDRNSRKTIWQFFVRYCAECEKTQWVFLRTICIHVERMTLQDNYEEPI